MGSPLRYVYKMFVLGGGGRGLCGAQKCRDTNKKGRTHGFAPTVRVLNDVDEAIHELSVRGVGVGMREG